MRDFTSTLGLLRDSPPRTVERRRTPRRAGSGAFLLFEVPTFSRDFCWPGTLVDINGNGLAMKLPPERLELDAGVPVYLSLLFNDRIRFDRVPAVFVRREGDLGAVEFELWPEEDRRRLLDLLLDNHAVCPELKW